MPHIVFQDFQNCRARNLLNGHVLRALLEVNHDSDNDGDEQNTTNAPENDKQKLILSYRRLSGGAGGIGGITPRVIGNYGKVADPTLEQSKASTNRAEKKRDEG